MAFTSNGGCADAKPGSRSVLRSNLPQRLLVILRRASRWRRRIEEIEVGRRRLLRSRHARWSCALVRPDSARKSASPRIAEAQADQRLNAGKLSARHARGCPGRRLRRHDARARAQAAETGAAIAGRRQRLRHEIVERRLRRLGRNGRRLRAAWHAASAPSVSTAPGLTPAPPKLGPPNDGFGAVDATTCPAEKSGGAPDDGNAVCTGTGSDTGPGRDVETAPGLTPAPPALGSAKFGAGPSPAAGERKISLTSRLNSSS